MPERNWKALTLLSIIVPVSLLATFRLAGIIQEPVSISQIITADIVTWNVTRPAINPRQIITIGEVINNSYTDEDIFINSSALIAGYFENRLSFPSDGDDDVLEFSLTVSTNVYRGYIHSATVRYSVSDPSSILLIEPHPEATFSRNLRIDRIFDPATDTREGYVSAVGVNQTDNAFLEVFAFLVFSDNNNLNHKMIVTGEIVYFDGAAYRQVNIPMQLEMRVP